MMTGKVTKVKNKNYYNKNNRKTSNAIDVNFRGFLCSCNNREKDCIRESYNILNKAADTLYAKPSEETEEHSTDIDDISDEIAKEVKDLKTNNSHKSKFNLCDSGAKNLLFIRTSLENPVEIAEHIARDVNETKQQQTKFLIRLVPIETTCKAYVADICKAFEPLAEKYFKCEPRTFSIIYNHRNNNSLSKDDVIKNIAEKISSMRDDHKVNLKEATVSVIIEVIKGFAFIGVVPNFLKFKKYNLLALCENSLVEDKTDLEDEK